MIMKKVAKTGITLREPAVVGDHAGVAPLVDEADEQEERAGGEAVVEHLEDRAAAGRSG